MTEFKIYSAPDNDIHKILDDGEIFVAIFRRHLTDRLQLRYLEKQYRESPLWYVDIDPETVVSVSGDVRFFKLTDDEQLRHVVWRVI